MRFFLDRGLGNRILPDGLRDAGWRLETMNERYGASVAQTISDVDWIRDAAARGEAILCKDRAIARVPLEADAIYYSQARVFVVASSQITGAQMLDRLLRNQEAIIRMAAREGPYVMGVYEHRISRLRLNSPR